MIFPTGLHTGRVLLARAFQSPSRCFLSGIASYPSQKLLDRRVFYSIPLIRFSSTASSNMSANSPHIVKRVTNIRKSPEDQREYRGIELSNKIKILLISDAKADKSAAAMAVGVGHLMDSWELPGTAHFCEHMLFLGTDKYPIENEYSKFIANNAGSSNAYTAADTTNYHFDIKPEKLHDTLDRFVQFFLCPQFTESATEREVCAVDSEHKNNINNDGWRNLQVDRFLSKPGHDYGKFGTGDKKTLLEDARAKGIEPREALLEFHKQWYSSNIMTCAIIGKESLDELEGYIGSLGFDSIENKNVDLKLWTENPYGADQLGKKIHVVPIKDTRSLKVTFPIPCFDEEYKSQPSHYLGFLLGHEGPGSLLSELKRRGWVSGLSAGENMLARGMSVFSVEVDLSSDGVEHTDQIVELMFGYIGMMQRSGPHKWIQDELKDIGETQFRFKDKENPLSFVTGVASSLFKRPFEDILCHRHLVSEYKPELIENILSCLTPRNMMYRVIAKKFENAAGNSKEPVYGTEMSIEDIEEKTLNTFSIALNTPNASFYLPEKNNYIPTKFDLKPRDEASLHPQVIIDNPWLRCWYKQDDEYNLPKMISKINVVAPSIIRDPKSFMLSSLFIWNLQDSLTEDTYNASLAGLRFDVNCDPYGLSLKVDGYDEKLPLFVEYLTKRLVNFKPDPLRFNVLFDSVKRALENFSHSQPYTLTQHYFQLLLSEQFWSKEQLLAVCKDIKVEDVEMFSKEMLNAFHVQMFCHGNTNKQEVIDLAENVTNILKSASRCRPLFRNEYVPLREHSLENGDNYLYRHFQSTHDVSAIEVLFQAGVQNNYDNTIIELICQIMREPAFNQLRTNEQLGYIIWSGSRLNSGTVGLHLIVQGPKVPDFVFDRVDAFLTKFRDDLIAMPAEEFQENVEALISKLRVEPKTLSARFRRFNHEIEARQFDFDRRTNEINVLQKVNKDDVLAFFDRKFAKGAPERRKISVFVHGKDHSTDSSQKYLVQRETENGEVKTLESPQEIECVERLRDSLSLYGRPLPKLNLPPIGVDILNPVSKY